MVFHLTKKKKTVWYNSRYSVFLPWFFLETDSTIKINVKKQRRYDRSTTIFKLNDKIFFMLSYNQLWKY